MIYDPFICSQLVAYNNTSPITRWVILVNNNLVYESGKYLEWDTWTFQLDTLMLKPGTSLTLKAAVEGDDSVADVSLIYYPNTATAYFELTDRITDTKLRYIETIDSSQSPPIHPCSFLVLYNNSSMLTKFSIHKLDGAKLYESGRIRMNKDLWLDLDELNVPLGTQIFVKSNCIGGADSTAYIIFEYTREDSYFSKIQLEGNAFKTVSMYYGTTV